MHNCPFCGKTIKNITNGILEFPYKDTKGNTYKLKAQDISYSKCNDCNEVFFDSKQSKNYDIQRTKAIENFNKQGELIMKNENFDEQLNRILNESEFEFEWEEYQKGVRGSFMKALAHAFDLADSKNLKKLADAFPELYPIYAEFHGDYLKRL